METYKNDPTQFPLFRKQILTKVILVLLFILVAGLATSSYSGTDTKEGFTAMLVYAGFLSVILVFTTFRALKQQKKFYESYELIMDGDRFTRKQYGLADRSILFYDIASITETEKGFIRIEGAHKQDLIIVMPYLIGYEDLKTALNRLKPLSPYQKTNLLVRLPYLTLIGVVLLMCSVFAAQNKFVVTGGGIALIALMLWSFFKTQTSSYFDKRTKRRIWIVWLVIISVAMTIYAKLSGM